MITSTFTFSDGTTTLYYEADSQVGSSVETVILGVHGMTTDLDGWLALANNLTVLAPVDIHLPIMRGYTNKESYKGDIPAHNQYDLDLEEIIEELGYEYSRIILIGHSAGAGNVARVLINTKTTASKLEAVCFAAPLFHPSSSVPKNRKKDTDWDMYYQRAVFYRFLERVNPWFRGKGAVMKIPLREIPYEEDSPLADYELSYRLFMGRFINPSLLAQLQQLRNASVWIGAEDDVVNTEKLKTNLEKSTETKISVIENEDHHSILTNPEFMRYIIETVGVK